MSAADHLVEFVPQSEDVPLASEVCGRELTKLRVGPTIRSGWRCARPACAPRRDKGAHHGAPVTSLVTITTTADPTCWKGDARGSS